MLRYIILYFCNKLRRSIFHTLSVLFQYTSCLTSVRGLQNHLEGQKLIPLRDNMNKEERETEWICACFHGCGSCLFANFEHVILCQSDV